MTAKNKSNEIRIVRIYDAPVKSVWEAWTDPKKLAKWWGPRGFTITTHSKDLRKGGTWKYTMHGPDGIDYPNTTFYHEVEKYSRLVYDHGGSDDRPPMFRVTVFFEEVKGQTKMDMTMHLPSPEAAEETRKFIKKAGGNSTWDRLAEYIEKESSDQDIFVVTRTVEAPIDVVFEMWTNPQHFAKWIPPTGLTMNFIRADIRTGGTSFYSTSGPEGTKIYGRAHYLEVTRPHRLIYTQQFCDENEKLSRHPLSPTWPETIRTTILLAEEGADQTRITLRWELEGKASPEERETFVKAKAGMTQGWTGSFDKLESYLMEQPRRS